MAGRFRKRRYLARRTTFFGRYQAHKRQRVAYAAPTVTVLYGATGTNKTRQVHEYVEKNGGYSNFHIQGPAAGSWFDGYAGQEIVLFDEYRGGLKWSELLYITDGYPGIKVQVKGGMVPFSPKHIFITSSIAPEEWYRTEHSKDHYAQFARRITKVVCTDPAAPSPLFDNAQFE